MKSLVIDKSQNLLDKQVLFHIELAENKVIRADKGRYYFQWGAKCNRSIQILSQMLKVSLFSDFMYYTQITFTSFIGYQKLTTT